MINSETNIKRLLGLIIFIIILTTFFYFNRLPKFDIISNDLNIINSPEIECFQGFCIENELQQSFIERWWNSSITYFRLVSIGMIFAFLVAGLSEAMIVNQKQTIKPNQKSKIINLLKALGIGPIMNLCSACIMPIAAAYQRQNNNISNTITVIQSSATLNLPTILMTIFVFSPYLGISKLLLSISAAIFIGPIVSLVIKKENNNVIDIPEISRDQKTENLSFIKIIKTSLTDWIKYSFKYCIKLGPPMLIAGVIGSLVMQWITRDMISTFLGNNLFGIIIAATIGLLINIPLMFEIPLVALLLILGMGKAPAVTLLFIAAAGGPITFWSLTKMIPIKGVGIFALSTWVISIIGGIITLILINTSIGPNIGLKNIQNIQLTDEITFAQIQGEGVILIAEIENQYLKPKEKLNINFGVENNYTNNIEGILKISVTLNDKTKIYTNEFPKQNFTIKPITKFLQNESIDIHSLTNTTGKMILNFELYENQKIIAKKNIGFHIGEKPKEFFNDITNNAMVDFKHIPQPNDDHPYGNGVAIADFNNDGFVDFYVTNHKGSNSLYKNNGDGTFTDVANELGIELKNMTSTGATFSDYDNDGDSDLLVLNNGENVLFNNINNVNFVDVTKSTNIKGNQRSISASWGDYNNDGYLDIYITNHIKNTFDEIFNKNINDGNNMDILYKNNGDGTFTDTSEILDINYLKNSTGFIASFFDYDNDNDSDIYLVNDIFMKDFQQGNILWENNINKNGSDGFINKSKESNTNLQIFGMGLDIGDYNNDGYEDLFMSNIGRPYLLKNNQDKTFTDITDISGASYAHIKDINTVSWGVNFFDYDNDGWQDIYIANGNMYYNYDKPTEDPLHQRNILLKNIRGEEFVDMTFSSGLGDANRSRATAVADYDNDGDLDLYLTNFNGKIKIFNNNSNNNWLIVKPLGIKSNTDGVGAKIEIKYNNEYQTRTIRNGSSVSSNSEIGAFFGLGNSNSIDELTITWPSNIKQSFRNININQKVLIEETKEEIKYIKQKTFNK